jgi:hypothetical protein
VASSDGLVTLTIPDGSAPVDAPITITALGEADAPPELEEIAFRGSFYRLGPADLALTGPVTIDRRIDLVALGIDPQQNGYPVVTLALRNAAGTWTWLAGQQLSFIAHAEGAPIEYELHTTATLTSLGDVYGFSSGLRKNIRLEPAASTFTIGESFTVFVSLDANAGTLPADEQPQLTSVLPFASQDGVIQFGTPNTTRSATGVELVTLPATCEQDTTVTVGANGMLSPAVIASDLLTRLKLGTDLDVGFLTGLDITCQARGVGAPTPTPEPPIARPTLYGGCVSVVHKPLSGGYPSYLEWVFEFDPLTIPRGAVLILVFAEEGSPDVTYEAPIAEGRATLQTGITKYGLKVFTGLSVRVGEPGTIGTVTYGITPTFQGFFGMSATVTEKEGSLAGNDCPTPILVP